MDWQKLQDQWQAFSERVGRFLLGLFGSRNTRVVQSMAPVVQRVAQLEEWAKGLAPEEFPRQTKAFRDAIKAGEKTLDDVLPEAFALAREAARRTLGMRHFDVQIVGGYFLHKGAIAEMATGEGKTLVATLPLYLNALTGRSAFLVTVNDYLARRDATWMSPIYEYLGLTVGAIQSAMHPFERLPVYACDIVYGTNNEFGFDYLRDNMKTRLEDQVQRDLYFAIVDEVDSILIDEARTPLIISGPAELTPDKYRQADAVVRRMERDLHFEIKEKERQAALTEEGIEFAEKALGVNSFYEAGNTDWPHYLENSIRAHHLYAADREYVVEEGEVVIVDEFTGRKMTGRRWSDGLHQAVETKEGLSIRQENQTLATITFQNYFRLYERLAGMTGTAMTEAEEFKKIYGLDVVQIPTNVAIARKDEQDIVYRTEPEKWKAIVDELRDVHGRGQPVLVGTTSVENSEKLSKYLNDAKIPHEVLNAKNHEREASIVARAGERGSVTVATNMAGRGTDIKLGGNFEHRLAAALEAEGLREGDLERLDEIEPIRTRVRAQCDADEKEVLALGGLYVLGTERHESRRIDNQLRGRSGRQGNVGASRFFLSLEDPLMKRFYRDWVKNAMEKMGMSEGVPIESGMVSRAIQRAQKKVEDYYFEIRKNLLEYDEVMDKQRKTIYEERQAVLEGVGLDERVKTMLERTIDRAAKTFVEDAEGFGRWFLKSFGFELDAETAQRATAKDGDSDGAVQAAHGRYDEREKKLGEKLMRQVDRYLLLNAIDTKWKDHLHAIDALKAGIGLRGYAQRDPKNEYKAEGFKLFGRLLESIEDDVSSLVLRVRVGGEDEDGEQASSGAAERESSASTDGPHEARAPEPEASEFAQPKRVFEGKPMTASQPGNAGTSTAASPARPAARPPAPAGAAFDVARRTAAMRQAAEQQAAPHASKANPYPNANRNEPCPCGSGKKYKRCHGASS
ncbi:MAG: preprotein translocase subunit SecA [Planctomycetaceae bacterium]|nr:preprotein translocase subunit SecA [Planctomycetaceae bacterium]